MQVPCHVNSLRSRASFIAVHGRQAKVVVWHGAKSPEQTRNIALHAADQVSKLKCCYRNNFSVYELLYNYTVHLSPKVICTNVD